MNAKNTMNANARDPLALSDDPRFRYLLRLADRSLVLSHRLSEWVTHGPELEEEIALANIALDLLGQSRMLLSYAAELEGQGRSEDDLAFSRNDRQYFNPLLVEQPNGDFAHTMARQLYHDAYASELWRGLTTSSDEHLAGLAAKAVKETQYHLRHSSGWVIRLGDGTDESHHRMQQAVDDLWRYTGELFEVDEVEQTLIDEGVAVDPRGLRARWTDKVEGVLAKATLTKPDDGYMPSGGRQGLHTEGLSYLLGEMQYLYHAYPGARW